MKMIIYTTVGICHLGFYLLLCSTVRLEDLQYSNYHNTNVPNLISSLKSGCGLSQSTLLNYGTHNAAEAKCKIISMIH